MLNDLLFRLRALFRRDAMEVEMDEELRSTGRCARIALNVFMRSAGPAGAWQSQARSSNLRN